MRTLPAVKVNFSTSADPQTDLKDSKVEVGVHGLTYFFDCVHLDLAQDLGNFVKAPPGVRFLHSLASLHIRETLTHVVDCFRYSNKSSQTSLLDSGSTFRTSLSTSLRRSSPHKWSSRSATSPSSLILCRICREQIGQSKFEMRKFGQSKVNSISKMLNLEAISRSTMLGRYEGYIY